MQIEKFQKYPDLTKVRKALDRAKDLGWIIGSYSYDLLKDGWKLTAKGIEEANKIKGLLKLKKNYSSTYREEKNEDFFKK